MVIKWKNFSRSNIIKMVLFIITIISLTTSIIMMQNIFISKFGINTLTEKNYIESSHYYYNIRNMFNIIYETLEGGDIDEKNFLKNLNYYNTRSVSVRDVTNNINFEKVDFSYSNGKQVVSNVKDISVNNYSGYIKLENSVISYGENTSSSAVSSISNFLLYQEDIDNYSIFLSLTDDSLSKFQEQWDTEYKLTYKYIIIFCCTIIISIICLILLALVIGRKINDEEIHLCKIDYIYTDIMLTIGILVSISWSIIFFEGLYYRSNNLEFILIDGLTIMCLITLLTILLSLIRHIKNKSLLSHTLIFTIFDKIFDFFKSIFDGRRFNKYPFQKALFKRQTIFICTLFILLAFSVFILPAILALVVIYWYIKGNKKIFSDISRIIEQIDEIHNGNIEVTNNVSKDSLLYDSLQNLSDIGTGLQKSLEQQIKGERMKVNLITNVSHDLKTPLTSIISYVELLSKEENMSEEAKDYVKILAMKSDRLKNIVSDLFDLARTTSGNVEIDAEKIDMLKLIVQTLADMDDKIEESGHIIKTKLPEEPVFIFTDGKKMYRVFQNIIDNALKYSMVGTRIFVDLEVVEKKAYATVKNTSSYEMDFTAEEILERFSRGDKSRTTDGNGLGLSIAKGFSNVCGGNFDVSIDGDQFKVTICFDIKKIVEEDVYINEVFGNNKINVL